MKKYLKIFTATALIFLLLHLALRYAGYGYLAKALWATYLHGANSATIDDVRFFDSHKIDAGANKWEWPVSVDYNKSPLPAKLMATLEKTESVAFLVVRNDSILAENYWDGYSDSSQSNSFSMAKSITTMLAQVAVQKGIFTGWHQKVNSILPDLKGAHASELELWHLSAMCSGLQWDEAYKDPFAVTAKSYYGENVNNLMLNLPIVDAPGKTHNYQSGNTELLGMCLMKATGKSLAELASEWLWKPLQAEHNAKWHTDDKGTELAFCCFNTDARDFARFGKMMLHHGNWNGTQILDSSFVELATSPTLVPFYGYSFWLDNSHCTKVFAQRGILGQYIITIPEYNLVVVRLGRHALPKLNNAPEDFHIIVEEVLGMVKGRS